MLSVLPNYLRTQLLDDDRNGTEDTGVAQALLDGGQGWLDGALSVRYLTPVASGQVSEYIKHLELICTRILAHERVGLFDKVSDQRDWITNELDMIASGDRKLGIDPLPDSPASISSATELTSATRVFSRALVNGVM